MNVELFMSPVSRIGMALGDTCLIFVQRLNCVAVCPGLKSVE